MSHFKKIQVFFVLLSLFLLPTPSFAEGFSIRDAQASFDHKSLSVHATFDLQLSEATEEALHNGVNINLVAYLDLFKRRRYILDERIARWAFDYEISFHALTNRYVLSSARKNESQSYSSLADLLNEIESFDYQSDIEGDTLPSSKQGYKLQLQIALDKKALPAPLRVMAYVLPAWKLKSDVHEWFIDH